MNKNIIVGTVVVLLLIAAGGAFWLAQNNTTTNTTSTNVSTDTNTTVNSDIANTNLIPPVSSPEGLVNNTSSVSIMGMAFNSSSLTVSAGTTVVWTNFDSVPHTVTSDDGFFDSGTIPAGGTYSHTFTTAGPFNYHCTIHGMKGSVIVE